MKCPNCGGTVPPGIDRCVKCGNYVEQPKDESQQQQQGQVPVQVIVQQAAPQPEAVAGTSDKSKVAAGILGILLGWLGVHRFYLGYGSIGGSILSLYVLGFIFTFTVCGAVVGIPMMIAAGLWGLIEGVMILTGAISKDAQGRTLQ